MAWNPFEFITETKKDFTNLFNLKEDNNIPEEGSRNAVIEIGIGKSAIIRIMEEKKRRNDLTKGRIKESEHIEI